jgi:hypothetical protein
MFHMANMKQPAVASNSEGTGTPATASTTTEHSASLYAVLPVAQQHTQSAQHFRLQKIGELEEFLRSEVECRNRLRKNYRRAVNAVDGVCGGLGVACVGMGACGAALLATGVGFILGLVLECATAAAGLLDVTGVAVSRRCSAKATKHEAVRMLAASKLNTVHNHISKALEDCRVSDDEYKLILDEVEKYRAMKEELRRRHAPAAGSSVIDEDTKNELIKRGREQARASFIKSLASESRSP